MTCSRAPCFRALAGHEAGQDRCGRGCSTSRTSRPTRFEFGFDSSTNRRHRCAQTGRLGQLAVLLPIRRSTAREGVFVWPSRANHFFLLVFPRLHRLVDSGAGAGNPHGGLCGCGGRRGGSPPCCPRGGGAAGRHGAGRGARRREGGRTARIGRAAAAGGQCRCCAGVRLRGTLARCRAVPASAPCPVRYVSVTLLYRLRAGSQVGVISTPPVGTRVGRRSTNIACG